MSTPLDICIVTADFVGPIRNGGIGTAYYNLAYALTGAGHHVTVLYTHGSYCENETIAYWRRKYKRDGMTFVPLPDTKVHGHPAIRMAYGVYEWLKGRHFDVVHCHEWRGVGFYAALGKRQGLCLQDAVLCVGAHSPGMWCLEGMNQLADAESLEVDYMERRSVALADVLWTPSAHMRDWLLREGWTLPKHVVHEPYILLGLERSRAGAASAGSELVFFGRLETRKGLDLFCDALDRLAARGVMPPHVTVLGKTSTVDGLPSDIYLARRADRWRFPWKIVSTLDRDGAMRYLRQPDRIAVLPSRLDNLPYTVLECLGSGIPFVASAIGGIPEMVRPRDRERVLFALDADALAERLTKVLAIGQGPAAMRVAPACTLENWMAWHEAIVALHRRSARVARDRHPLATRHRTAAALPLVTVCLVTRNRPAFLDVALASLRAQSYPRVEVVLVDDGSDDVDAIAHLTTLEPEFRRRGWPIIRQPNRYVGAARNAAAGAARGDYLLFMDDDNIAAPNAVSTFVGAAERSGADVLSCFMHLFRSAQALPARMPPSIWPFLGGALASGVLRNVFGDANSFFRRSVFTRLGGFHEHFGVSGEDWELLARAVLSGFRVDVVPEPLVRYRQSGQGMWHTTSHHANHMRALRPYFELLPAHLRPLVHLTQRERATDAAPPPNLDHVRNAVVFGSGEGGRLALGLASRCGWTVPWIVDNNPAAWNTTAHGLPVKAPASLKRRGVDLVIVASLAGRPSISSQLERMGLAHGKEFVHFLDAVKVQNTTLQLSLQ
ncbi:MAG: glycosyltransferase [Acidobacteriota bacterium]